MRGTGWLLLGLGGSWLLYALSLDTSVALPFGGRVQNLSLMEARRTQLMLSGGAILVGVLLLGFWHEQRAPDDDDEAEFGFRQCPLCAELVRVEAVICKHCRSELPASGNDEAAPAPEELAEEDESEQDAYSYRTLRDAAETAENLNTERDPTS